MSWFTKTRVKYALAGAGALYLVLFAGYLIYAGTRPATADGPSDLEAHPEMQDEILARRRAEEMRDQLKLSEEQTQALADIYMKNKPDPNAEGDPRERWRAMQEAVSKVLTPEQQAQLEQTRGQFRGPGGPRTPISPERIESLKEKMTPEQRQRFEKAEQRMQQFRGQGRGGRGPGGQRGPGGGGRGPGQYQAPEQQ